LIQKYERECNSLREKSGIPYRPTLRKTRKKRETNNRNKTEPLKGAAKTQERENERTVKQSGSSVVFVEEGVKTI